MLAQMLFEFEGNLYDLGGFDSTISQRSFNISS